MSEFSEFENEVITGTKGLAQRTLANFATQATSDTQQFIDNQKQKLITWGNQLKNRQIDAEQFEFNVGGQLDLAEMHALTQAGITAVQVQQFRDALIKIVVDAAVKHFIPI